jgi:uncharacterized RDD family membrane protein YckC
MNDDSSPPPPPPPPPEGRGEPTQPERRDPSIPARLLGTAAGGAQRVARATGVERTVETVAEEAIVRAIESEAVERALIRLIDSAPVDRVWDRFLDSDELERIVERVAQSDEVRNALAAQSVGFVGDIGRRIGVAARTIDDALQRAIWRLFRRAPREGRAEQAGFVTRVVALGVDAALLSGAFFLVSTIVAFVVSTLFGAHHQASTNALVVGGALWFLLGGLYLLTFWALAGETPGMRFLGIRMRAGDTEGLGLRRAIRRLFGFALSAIPFGAGFLPVLFGRPRRGLHDRIAGTEVTYDEPGARRR